MLALRRVSSFHASSSTDIGIAALKLSDRALIAGLSGGLTLIVLLTLWYFIPLAMPRRVSMP